MGIRFVKKVLAKTLEGRLGFKTICKVAEKIDPHDKYHSVLPLIIKRVDEYSDLVSQADPFYYDSGLPLLPNHHSNQLKELASVAYNYLKRTKKYNPVYLSNRLKSVC
jgi:hypothetical protein